MAVLLRLGFLHPTLNPCEKPEERNSLFLCPVRRASSFLDRIGVGSFPHGLSPAFETMPLFVDESCGSGVALGFVVHELGV